MKCIVILIMFSTIITLYVTRPSPEDIQMCADETGWSKDRCLVELLR